MRIQIMSDLHLEFHRDGGQDFIDSLDPTGVDVLVLAGDICLGEKIPQVMHHFCGRYPQVVYVLGNHEYYGSTRERVRRSATRAANKNDNLHWLDNSSAVVNGTLFVGGSLWFRRNDRAPKWALNDFRMIKNFESWVYQENVECIEALDKLIEPGCVVVTHHLPSERSVARPYKDSPLNPFFVCDVHQQLVKPREADFWFHGHTHSSMNYEVGHTRVICNPFGYLGSEVNHFFDDRLVVEVPRPDPDEG